MIRHRRPPAMAVAKSSIGGLPRKHFIRPHLHPADPSGLRICRMLARPSLPLEMVKPCKFLCRFDKNDRTKRG
jgi:hypothetical protein